MNPEEMSLYEGQIVYFLHKLSEKDLVPSRWSRGIIYKGTCYDISLECKSGQAPSIHLETIKSDYISFLNVLQKSQYSELEQNVLDTLLSGNHDFSHLKVRVMFDPWREDKEKNKERKNKEKEDERIREIDKKENLANIITQLESAVSRQHPLSN